jgi:LCP family protein required for cell wall assembly
MADRPQGPASGQGPEPGTHEYNWLYGSKRPAQDDDATQMIRPQSADDPNPDATRVMPATRPAQQPPPPPAPPPKPAPRDSGSGGSRRPRRGLPRLRFRPLRWVLLLLLLWLVFLVAVPIIAVNKVSKVDAFPDGERPDDQDGTTYLVVGSDKADDLSEEQRERLRTGPRSTTRTDTIMLLHQGAGPNLLMSLPRDLLVDIPDQGTGQINGTYDGNPRLLIRTIEANTGIRVDHYIELGFGSIINTTDALGGIEICPKSDIDDPKARLQISEGCQEVDGETALGYSRTRASTRADLDRVGRQREVVSALGDKVISPWTVINPFRYWGFNMAAAEAVRISEGTGPIDMGRFAWAMTRVTGDAGMTCTAPILPAPSDPNRLVFDENRAPQMFQRIIEDDTDGIGRELCTPTGLPRDMTR